MSKYEIGDFIYDILMPTKWGEILEVRRNVYVVDAPHMGKAMIDFRDARPIKYIRYYSLGTEHTVSPETFKREREMLKRKGEAPPRDLHYTPHQTNEKHPQEAGNPLRGVTPAFPTIREYATKGYEFRQAFSQRPLAEQFAKEMLQEHPLLDIQILQTAGDNFAVVAKQETRYGVAGRVGFAGKEEAGNPLIYGWLTPALAEELKRLMEVVQWPPPEEPSPTFSAVLQVCDYAFRLKALKRKTYEMDVGKSGDKKILIVRLLNAGEEELTDVAQRTIAELKARGLTEEAELPFEEVWEIARKVVEI